MTFILSGILNRPLFLSITFYFHEIWMSRFPKYMLFEIKKLLGENICAVKIGEINEFRTKDDLSLRPSVLN